MLDAIGRTLARLLVTRRRLLEWVTADRDVARPDVGAASYPAHVPRPRPPRSSSPCFVAQRRSDPASIGVVRSRLVALSPAIAYVTGHPARRRHAPPTARRARSSTLSPASTWRFFDELVGPVDNWLVPDNVQENRRERIAHRTSPTNIGLQLLSTLAARDFGYLTTSASSCRGSSRPSRPCSGLPRYRGPLLQLVRHDDADAAAAGLHLDGRQRQPRRVLPDALFRSRRNRATGRSSTSPFSMACRMSSISARTGSHERQPRASAAPRAAA